VSICREGTQSLQADTTGRLLVLGYRVYVRIVERGKILFFGVLRSRIYVWIRFSIKAMRYVTGNATAAGAR
jgi:hypothetical protein